jgi:nucleotide-binding universal stress UspA family protein
MKHGPKSIVVRGGGLDRAEPATAARGDPTRTVLESTTVPVLIGH